MENCARPVDAYLWMDAMRRGDFKKAWCLADQTLNARAGRPCWHWPRHEQYVWDGAPLDGKRVLVRCYHGLGDTVQFIRFASLLKARAAEVIVWAQLSLLPLVRAAEGVDRVLALHDGSPEIAYDADVELMELAHIFRVARETLPRKVPYLSVPRVEFALSKDRFHIGVIWRSGDWDERRSMPMELLAPLTAIPFVTLHAMQHGPTGHGWPREWGPVCPATNPWETAQWMQALDLIISVDSFPAHLAGALGRPVWTLLSSDADWRWMESCADSPWYPTMRLFRQRRAGDWAEVIARVERRLRRLGGGRARNFYRA
jgi:hypothetical protein